MTVHMQHGAPQFPTVVGNISTQETMDAAVETLQAHKDEWVNTPIEKRIAILDQLLKDFSAIEQRWVEAGNQAKGITRDGSEGGEEWGAGTWPVVKNIYQLRQSLANIQKFGHPIIPGPVTTRPDGQVVAQVFPQTLYDSLFFTGLTAEIWMEPGVTAEGLTQTQAMIYHDKQHEGKVALILGAGNVASIAPTDVLYKLFVEDQVVLLKMNPVNAYIGPLIEESFRALIEPGFLRVTYGGAAEGAYLCNHAGIDEIHITGSDKTFDAVVFGPGPEGAARKASNQPLSNKRVTGELGNVSPVIVVPGPWSESDLTYQAEHIVTMLTNNAGFNCNATRVIIQQAGWAQREPLLRQVRQILSAVPTRNAYYPGAQARHQAFVEAHPDAEQFGSATDKQLPWTLVAGVDSAHQEDICFTTEAFCGLFAETTLDATSSAEYLDKAVDFANDKIWGSLNVTILIHPTSLKDPQVAAALDRALANLRYGTVSVNQWAGTNFVLGVTTWGAYPGHAINDIQSGTGVVHNTLMFAHPQKTVMRAPFRATPTPPWFATRGRTGSKLFPKIVKFEEAPAFWKVPSILWTAIKG